MKATSADLPTIVYSIPGKEAVAVITSYATRDEIATVQVDLKTLGFPNGCVVTNGETNQPITMMDGRIVMPLKKHDMLVLRFMAAK